MLLAELVEANNVIHLWRLDGEALLALNRPALAALIGQTRLRNPEPTLRQAVEQIVTGTSGELQRLLLIEFLTLCTDKEVAAMAEQIVQYDSYGDELERWMEEQKNRGTGELRNWGTEELGNRGTREQGNKCRVALASTGSANATLSHLERGYDHK
ncbi:hypothetical protein CJ255_20435 [Candidatus Viridilinea mediisalina]|uniref:Uncharacterized protein n=2 Tax=Candidatus Viridilinea mediisalina TaxID=2024553 RepID=A0A2A6RE83_9CHLR|nr:hypothetical protein CJ255_20435 [Candidatus Viridilinea mediisalina]